jgi:Ca-activated chloride channel family protein
MAASMVVACTAIQVARAQSGTVFHGGVELVALTVTVEDARGRYISSLNADDFRVFDNGVQQQVQYFGGDEVPIDLLLMIDTSSSMFERIKIARAAASNFVRVIGPSDRASIMGFASNAQVLVPFTGERPVLEDAIRRLAIGGNTALYNSLYVALKQFGSLDPVTGDVRRRAIVLLSDGDDTTSLVSFDSLLDLARRSGIAIYVISFNVHGQPGDHVVDQGVYRMRVLARETGAASFFPKTITDLDGVYQEIAQELAHQYALAYVPAVASRRGEFRKVAVTVDQSDVRVRTRSGYIAE